MAVRRHLRRVGRRFLNLGAGVGAQPEILLAIRRWRQLPESVRSTTSLWAWLLGPEGTPPYKIDRDDIAWAEHPVNGRSCEGCQRWYIHWVTKTGICDKVSGVWDKDWWCSAWEAPADVETYRAYQK